MFETEFDLSGLQSRINEIKVETTFTRDFLECLMTRHDLQYSIPEEYKIEIVPDNFLDTLRKGELPTEDEILQLNSEAQNTFMFEMVLLCGLNAIAFYTKDETADDGTSTVLEQVMAMLSVSPAHYIGCYIIAAHTLLMCRVPSFEMIETITNNFSTDEDQIQRSYDMFVELTAAVFTRFQEDRVYYLPTNSTEET